MLPASQRTDSPHPAVDGDHLVHAGTDGERYKSRDEARAWPGDGPLSVRGSPSGQIRGQIQPFTSRFACDLRPRDCPLAPRSNNGTAPCRSHGRPSRRQYGGTRQGLRGAAPASQGASRPSPCQHHRPRTNRPQSVSTLRRQPGNRRLASPQFRHSAVGAGSCRPPPVRIAPLDVLTGANRSIVSVHHLAQMIDTASSSRTMRRFRPPAGAVGPECAGDGQECVPATGSRPFTSVSVRD